MHRLTLCNITKYKNRNKMKKILFIILMIIWGIRVYPQQISSESINSCGATFQAANNGISLTIGELVVSSLGNDSITMGQGFNQINQTITTVEPISEPKKNFKVFPNPTSQELYIQIDLNYTSELKFKLYNIGGKTIMQTDHIKNSLTKLDLNLLPSGIYILTIYERKNEIASYKIQKINY